MLTFPPGGSQFNEGDVISLQWMPVGTLASDAYYVPVVTYAHGGSTWTDDIPWTKGTAWTLSDHAYLLDLCDDGVFHWSVQVMLKTGVDPVTGKWIGVQISAQSEIRSLKWSRPGAPPDTPEPTDTPIPP